MKREYKVTIGSISHGTLRPEDLIDAYAWELRQFAKNEGEGRLTVQEAILLAMCDSWLETAGEECEPDMAKAEELLDDLTEALESRAPPYCYFGNTQGDGSDFGFWPDMDAINDLPCVENSDEARDLGEDCRYVNDHGNVTVYGGDGSVIIDFV